MRSSRGFKLSRRGERKHRYTSSQNVEFVKGVYGAFGRGDIPAVLGAFADDVEWFEAEGMPYGGLYRSGEAVLQNVFGPIAEDLEGFAVTPEEYIGSGATVVAIVRYKGTGKALDEPAVHVWEIRDGKLTRFRQFIDTVKFAEVVPAGIAAA